MASHVNGCEAAVRQESVVAFRRFARTVVELVLRRLRAEKASGRRGLCPYRRSSKFVAKVLRTSYGSGGDLSRHSIRELN